jgi:hypothetical protein
MMIRVMMQSVKEAQGFLQLEEPLRIPIYGQEGQAHRLLDSFVLVFTV